jgi:hypothetical protein
VRIKEKKLNKKMVKRLGLMLAGLMLAGLALGGPVMAQEDHNLQPYESKEAIPGQEKTSDFVEYVEGLYKFGVGGAIILAIFMIGVGGFMYVVTSAGNAAKMGDAKSMIMDALFGLVLAMLAYLILYVVNPDLVGGLLDRNEGTTVDEKVKQDYQEAKQKIQQGGN